MYVFPQTFRLQKWNSISDREENKENFPKRCAFLQLLCRILEERKIIITVVDDLPCWVGGVGPVLSSPETLTSRGSWIVVREDCFVALLGCMKKIWEQNISLLQWYFPPRGLSGYQRTIGETLTYGSVITTLLDLQLFRGHREHYANLTRTFAKELWYVSGYLMMEWYTHHFFFYSTSSIWLCIWNLPLRPCPWCQGLGIAHPVSCDVDMSSLLNWIKTETNIRKISRSNLAHTKHCSMYDINYSILFKRNAGCKRKNCQILSPRFNWSM